jgi:hypothetical protein
MAVSVSGVSSLNGYDSITNECLRRKLWFIEEERLEKNKLEIFLMYAHQGSF